MSNQKFSIHLADWLNSKEPKTLGQLQTKFGSKSFAVAFMLLMILTALPLPTAGLTHALDIITMLLALELIAGRQTIWLPKWANQKSLGKIMTKKALPKILKWVTWFERLSRPRLSLLFLQPWLLRFTGLLVLVFTLAAFFAPLFTGLDTLPGLGVVLVALGWLFEDSAIFTVGMVLGSLGILLEASLGVAIFHLLR